MAAGARLRKDCLEDAKPDQRHLVAVHHGAEEGADDSADLGRGEAVLCGNGFFLVYGIGSWWLSLSFWGDSSAWLRDCKAIRRWVEERQDFSSGAVIITSRASDEMMQKAATARMGFIAAISALTELAIRLAPETGVTLIGFVRHQGHVIHAGAQRLI